jgi:hypothetical protein
MNISPSAAPSNGFHRGLPPCRIASLILCMHIHVTFVALSLLLLYLFVTGVRHEFWKPVWRQRMQRHCQCKPLMPVQQATAGHS